MAPNVAHRLLELRDAHNAAATRSSAPFPVALRGLAIGDGWVDPIAQNRAFPAYAFALGLIGDALRATLSARAEACAAAIAAGNYTRAFDGPCYYHLLNPIVTAAGGVSPYARRKKVRRTYLITTRITTKKRRRDVAVS